MTAALRISSAPVAVLGHVFFGALEASGGPEAFSPAMTLSLLVLAVVALTFSVLAQALPRGRP